MSGRAKNHALSRGWLSLAAALLFLLPPLVPTGALAADGFTTAWLDPQPTGLLGVAFDLLRMPEGGFRGYYMGPQGFMVAASPDGLAWQALDGLFVPSPGPGLFPSNPWVFVTLDGRYRMIYEARDDQGNRRFHAAVSADGLGFVYEGLVMAGTDEDRSPPDGHIGVSVPTGLRLPDGRLRMYFAGGSVGGTPGIASAVSSDDGLTWAREPGECLLGGMDPAVMALPGGGVRMFFSEWRFEDLGMATRLGYADAADGRSFTFQEWIIMTTGPSGFLADPEPLVQDAPEAGPGQVRLFFSLGDRNVNDANSTFIYALTSPPGWSLAPYPVRRP